MRKTTFILPVLVLAVVAMLSAIFIVDEREKALVLQFGRVVAVKEEPGLAFKIPLIQEVVTYDDRILSREVGPLEITPLDDRRDLVTLDATVAHLAVALFYNHHGKADHFEHFDRSDDVFLLPWDLG